MTSSLYKLPLNSAFRACHDRGLTATVVGDRLHFKCPKSGAHGSVMIGWDDTVSTHALTTVLASFPLKH